MIHTLDSLSRILVSLYLYLYGVYKNVDILL